MNMQQPVDGTLMVKKRFVREMLAALSCLTLHDPMECNLPDSSVPGILQARPRSHSLLRGVFMTQALTWVSRIAGRFFTI